MSSLNDVQLHPYLSSIITGKSNIMREIYGFFPFLFKASRRKLKTMSKNINIKVRYNST